MTHLVGEPSAFFEAAREMLAGPKPAFLSRIGGSDTSAVVDYLRVKVLDPLQVFQHMNQHLPIVSRYNGFYDLENPQRSYFDYLRCLHQVYLRTSVATLCNFQLLSIYFRAHLPKGFIVENFENKAEYIELIESIARAQPAVRFYPYQFIEQIVLGRDSLFRVFSTALRNRRVLVVSPFSESIMANFKNRHEFFRHDYQYPDFELELVNTPITYAGLPASMYPHSNWLDTLEALKAAIAQKSFDVALLSCGSYALPLGDYIAASMGRKAIYVGGVLQLFFGIIGRRYVNPFFTDQINREKFILPVERERYLKHVEIPSGLAHEAFGAYF